WVATGKSCPLCRSLNGKTVDINTPFMVRGKKHHPPAHRGCDCHLAADNGVNLGGGGNEPIRNTENFRKEIAEGKIPLKIRKQKQLEHTLDSVKYQEYVERLKKAGWKPSILTADAQEMVDKYAGISDLKWIRGHDYPREYFTHSETVGRYWDKDIKDYVDTSRAVIVYSNKGTHVFPVR
ncbi:MAG: polymorphic toxin type 50 domain-containing protein, partial [Syntrophomonadaceae bacterium]